MKHFTLSSLAFVAALCTQGQIIFQSGLENWSSNLPTDWYGSRSNLPQSGVVQVTTNVHGGSSAVRLIKASSGHQRFTTQPVTVVDGQAYEVSFWVRGEGQIRIGLFDGRAATSGYAPYNPQGFVTITGNTWQQVTLNVTAAMNASNAEFILSLQNTVAPEHLVVDDVTISEVIVPPPAYHTIQEIQQTSAPDGISPLNGMEVTTSGVVTGVDTIGADGYFIQDGQGAWSGLYVFDSGHAVAIGDSLSLAGTVSEFNNKTELGTITAFTNHGTAPVPTPEMLTPTAAKVEDWEGVLVQVADIGATNLPTSPYYEWTASGFQGTIIIDDVMYLYTPVVGTYYTITGIMDQFQSDFKLCPRQLSDIGVGSAVADLRPRSMGVHPVPADNTVSLATDRPVTGAEYVLADMMGRVVWSDALVSNTIPVGGIPDGSYLLTVTMHGQHYQARLVVRH